MICLCKYIYTIIFLFYFSHSALTQELHWAEIVSGNNTVQLKIIEGGKDRNVYLGGYFDGSMLNGDLEAGDHSGLFFIKFNKNGEILWYNSLNGLIEFTVTSLSIAGMVEAGNHLYITGFLQNGGPAIIDEKEIHADGFVIALNKETGKVDWVYEVEARCFAIGFEDEVVNILCGSESIELTTNNYVPDNLAFIYVILQLNNEGELVNSQKVMESSKLQNQTSGGLKIKSGEFLWKVIDATINIGDINYTTPSDIGSALLLFEVNMNNGESKFDVIFKNKGKNMDHFVLQSGFIYVSWNNVNDTLKFGDQTLYPLYNSNYVALAKFDVLGDIEWVKDIHSNFGPAYAGTFSVNNNLDIVFTVNTPFDKLHYEGNRLEDSSAVLRFDADGELIWQYGVHANFQAHPTFSYGSGVFVSSRLTSFDFVQFGNEPIYGQGQGFALALLDEFSFFVESDFENDNFYIFPNPVQNIIYFKGIHNDRFKDVKVYDLYGKKISHLNGFHKNSYVDVSHLPEGMYILMIICESDKEYYKKFIISNKIH